MFITGDLKTDAAADTNPEHYKAIPASNDPPAPAVGKYRPNNNGNQTRQRTGKVVTYCKKSTTNF